MAGTLLDDEFRALIAILEADTAVINMDTDNGVKHSSSVINFRVYEALQSELVARKIISRLPGETIPCEHIA